MPLRGTRGITPPVVDVAAVVVRATPWPPVSAWAFSLLAVGGAVSAAGTGSFILNRSRFVGNTATGQGAAVDYDPSGCAVCRGEEPVMEDNKFEDNAGLSTMRYTNKVRWICAPGQFAPSTGSIPGDFDGCPQTSSPGYFVVATEDGGEFQTAPCPAGSAQGPCQR